jgi:diadenylate cyclase
MVRRIADEIEGYVVELGDDGRLVALQLEELTGGVEDERRLVGRDYFVESDTRTLEVVITHLAQLSDEELLDLRVVASLLGLPADLDLDSSVQPRGYRLLARIPRLPDSIADHVIERFGRLPKIMRASISDLVSVEGVGEARARAIKDGLARVAESSILDRYS